MTAKIGGWPILLKLSLFALLTRRVPHPFAFCAKGWAARASTYRPENPRNISPWCPPLQRTQEWGTLCLNELKIKKGRPPAGISGCLKQMKQNIRDNLIYLAAGLGIAALLAADFFYSLSHHIEMWRPSKLAFRGVFTTSLLTYFVIREARKLKMTLLLVLGCALFACIVHLAIIFVFRHTVDELSGIVFSALAVWEIFFVFELTMVVVRYLSSER